MRLSLPNWLKRRLDTNGKGVGELAPTPRGMTMTEFATMTEAEDAKQRQRRSLHLQRRYADYTSLMNEIISLYQRAAKEAIPFEEILEQSVVIQSRPSYKRLTAQYKAQLVGVVDAMNDLHSRNVLVWTLVLNGKRYDSRHPALDGNYSKVTEHLGTHCYRFNGRFIPFTDAERKRDDELGIESIWA